MCICPAGWLRLCRHSKNIRLISRSSILFHRRNDNLTVGFDAEYPPYGYMDDETGDYTGFDLELAEAVCEIYGWKLVKTPINWDAKDTELNSGAIDCIWNGFTYTGRENDYTFSDPLCG